MLTLPPLNMNSTFIRSLVFKDLRQERWPIFGYLTFLLLRYFTVSDGRNFLFPEGAPEKFVQVVSIVMYFSILLFAVVVIVRWVQSDPTHDSDAFWVTRPARTKHLLAAKLLNVAGLFFVLPTLLELVVGFRLSGDFGALWAIPNTLWVCGLHVAPILFIASISSRLDKTLLLAIPFALALGLSLLLSRGLWKQGFGFQVAPDWQVSLAAIWGIGFFAAFIVQSLRGTRKDAIGLALVFVFVGPWLAIPRLENAKQRRLDNLETASGFELDPVENSYFANIGRGSSGERVWVERNLVARDSDEDRVLRPFRLVSRFTDRSGEAKWVQGNLNIRNGWFPFVGFLRDSGFTNSSEQIGDRNINARVVGFYDGETPRLPEQGTSIEVAAYFSEFREKAYHEIPLLTGEKIVRNSISSSVLRLDLNAEVTRSLGSRVVRIELREEKFKRGFRSGIYTGSRARRFAGDVLRLYYLYDRDRQVFLDTKPYGQDFGLGGSYPNVIAVDFVNPGVDLAIKRLDFEYWPEESGEFDPSRFVLVALDVQNMGDRKATCEFSGDSLSVFVEGFRERNEMQNSVNARNPKLVINGDDSSGPVLIEAKPGSSVTLSAEGSSDPEGGPIGYSWAIRSARGHKANAAILTASSGVSTTVTITAIPFRSEIHVDLFADYEGMANVRVKRTAIISVSPDVP